MAQLWAVWTDGAATDFCRCFYEITYNKRSDWVVAAIFFLKKLNNILEDHRHILYNTATGITRIGDIFSIII
jgi:hypothetical protein